MSEFLKPFYAVGGSSTRTIEHSSPGVTENTTTDTSRFISKINYLEGVKTKIKAMHWGSKNLNVKNTLGVHKFLDEYLDILSSFQDTLAESSQGILGVFDHNLYRGEFYSNVQLPGELLSDILINMQSFHKSLCCNNVYSGICSEIEVFILNTNKYKYLFNLVE